MMRAAVVVFPGSNCEGDVVRALDTITGKKTLRLRHDDNNPPAADLYVLPGGFSFGDYLRAGALAARCPVMREITARARNGSFLLGICNGFQILIEAGLLPGSLIVNRHLRFICRPQNLTVESSIAPFTHSFEKNEQLSFPIAHQTGCYAANDSLLHELETGGQIAFRYKDGNPNGSCHDIAGVFDSSKRILGLMPHPERAIHDIHDSQDGLRFFSGLLNATM